MNDWLAKARADLAQAVGDIEAAYDLSQEDIDELLELARVAAHDSGERPTAPIATYLLGLARGRHPEQAIPDLVDAVAGKRAS
jgi:hypothetical protein